MLCINDNSVILTAIQMVMVKDLSIRIILKKIHAWLNNQSYLKSRYH